MLSPSCGMDLVRNRCTKMRYFGATLRESLVEDTPIETDDVSRLICPTKSSALKHHWALGFKCLEPQTMWMKLWCFGTIWKLILSFSKDHLLSQSYFLRNSPAKSNDWWCSAGERNTSALSQISTSFFKLVAVVSICCSHSSSVPEKTFSITGIIAGNKCLASPALMSRLGCFFQGFCASVNILNLRLVSLFLHPCSVYWACTWVNRMDSLSQGFLDCLWPGPS